MSVMGELLAQNASSSPTSDECPKRLNAPI